MSNPEKSKPQSERRERQDWGIVLLILLVGLCCVAGAGQYALRFAPFWQADTNMESNLDLDSEFLTNKPIVLFEPLDPAILTQPGWVNGGIYLTPGADFVTGTPLPASTNTEVPTITGTIVPTNTLALTASPTNTLVWIPLPATKTSNPGPGPTNTSPPGPLPSADLGIAQIEVPPTGTYVPGGTLTYTVTVTNAGPSNVIGATVTDAFTAQVTGASWSCVAVGTTCGAGGPGAINDVVNLPVGSMITYTVNVNISAGGSGDLVHTATVTLPAGYTDPGPLPNVATDTNTAAPIANLWITKDDGVPHYLPGGNLTYTVTVGNTGPSNVIGATVTDTFPAVLTANWTCGSATGGSCTGAGVGDISDSFVNLPVGSTVIYTIDVTIDGGASGNLDNTASVSLPAGYGGATPVSVTHTDTLITTDPPPGEIGSSPDGNIYSLGMGSSLTLPINLTADGNTGDWDLVYYELLNPGAPNPDFVLLDWVIIEISDGYNWYTVYHWGNGASDGNTNVASFSPEIDEFQIDIPSVPSLYPPPNGTGVAIDVDSIVLPGNYIYIRFTSPNSGVGAPADGSTDIDAFEVLP